ncbi:hypothetical protein UA08_07244 [Talaromyces atroroseus]|uniref:Uncharacterized protein n=1 Tax=Talaromyces atroroseus TaxID=1441469 RepID=A0A225AH76_TALAT|nr:hypothetical protein UA08_07244 [Talaromyces atroroseus]OKL57504.1 hypothetical protein UA08_07244 [Talaromyces atroroseus]
MQLFGDELSFPDLLREARDAFSKLPKDEAWIPYPIKIRLEQMLQSAEVASNLDELNTILGQNDQFDVIVLKMALEILPVHLRSLTNEIDKDAAPAEEAPYAEQTLEEAPYAEQTLEEPTYKEPTPEEAPCEEEIPSGTIRTYVVRVSPADFALYKEWENLSYSKKKILLKKSKPYQSLWPEEF